MLILPSDIGVGLDLGLALAGIHLEKDMCVPFGHTVARTVCLFEI